MSAIQPGVYCFIEADTNDADYVGKMTLIQAEDADLLERFGAALHAQKKHYNFFARWGDDRYLSYHKMYPQFDEAEWETLFEYIPSGGEEGVHSITQFKVFGVIGGNDMMKGGE